MYEYFISLDGPSVFEEVTGIDRLLTKLEYNTFTDDGRIASDYGVPAKVVDYYENRNSDKVKQLFDHYELDIFNRVDTIIKKDK